MLPLAPGSRRRRGAAAPDHRTAPSAKRTGETPGTELGVRPLALSMCRSTLLLALASCVFSVTENAFQGLRPSIDCLTRSHVKVTAADRALHNASMQKAMQSFAECGLVAMEGAVWDDGLLSKLDDALGSYKSRSQCSVEEVPGVPCAENKPGLLELELTLDRDLLSRFKQQLDVLKPLLDTFLEEDYEIEFLGALTNSQSDHPQPWHTDGIRSLFKHIGVQLPPHCVTVFVPLGPCTVENGCTEFLAGNFSSAAAFFSAPFVDFSFSLSSVALVLAFDFFSSACCRHSSSASSGSAG